MEVVKLRSGREIAIRPITAADGPSLQAAYDQLTPESKYRRFMGIKPHLSDRDTRYLVEVDGHDHLALLATPVKRPQRILAVGRYVRLREDPRAAEFAIVVGDPYQRQGIASVLLRRLADAAVAAGIDRFVASILADNLPAHRMVHRLAGTQVRRRHAGGVDELEITLAPAPAPAL